VAIAIWSGFYRLAPEEPWWVGLLLGGGASLLGAFAVQFLLSMPPLFRWMTVGATVALGTFWLVSQPGGSVPWWIVGPGMFGIVWLGYVRDHPNVKTLGRRDVWIALGLTVLLLGAVAAFLAVGKYFQNQISPTRHSLTESE
jgi:hypothetical protein